MEFFNPIEINDSIHIIGLGAIGSHVALQVARLGLTNIHIYDFDEVEPVNVANQNYFDIQIGNSKVEETAGIIKAINPDAEISLHKKGWTKENNNLSGYVFLCLDNIDTRREICLTNKLNRYIKAIFDFRMGLSDAQHYAADWSNSQAKERILETMDFTHEEAKENIPVSACGTTLSVLPTIWTVVAAGLANFINFIKNNLSEEPLKVGYKHMILINPFAGFFDAF